MKFPSRNQVIIALFLTVPLSGCNTMSGMGQDLTGTANYLQEYMPQELQKGGAQPYPGGAFTMPQPVRMGVPALSGI